MSDQPEDVRPSFEADPPGSAGSGSPGPGPGPGPGSAGSGSAGSGSAGSGWSSGSRPVSGSGRPGRSGGSGQQARGGGSGQPGRASQSGNDLIGDMQRWLIRSGAKNMRREITGQVRRKLGTDRSEPQDVWGTATTEPPAGDLSEAPECAWCPVCRAARRIRESGPDLGSQLSGAGGAVAAAVQEALSAFDGILTRTGSGPGAERPRPAPGSADAHAATRTAADAATRTAADGAAPDGAASSADAALPAAAVPETASAWSAAVDSGDLAGGDLASGGDLAGGGAERPEHGPDDRS